MIRNFTSELELTFIQRIIVYRGQHTAQAIELQPAVYLATGNKVNTQILKLQATLFPQLI